MDTDKSPQDEITRLIQEGRRPHNLKGRVQLAVDKLRGNVPRGVDAPNKTSRKIIGGAASLFIVLKYGFLGLFAILFGGLFAWAGFYGQFDIKVVGIGIAALVIGIFALRHAWRAWGTLKAISRA
jgi:hypothetical protein